MQRGPATRGAAAARRVVSSRDDLSICDRPSRSLCGSATLVHTHAAPGLAQMREHSRAAQGGLGGGARANAGHKEPEGGKECCDRAKGRSSSAKEVGSRGGPPVQGRSCPRRRRGAGPSSRASFRRECGTPTTSARGASRAPGRSRRGVNVCVGWMMCRRGDRDPFSTRRRGGPHAGRDSPGQPARVQNGRSTHPCAPLEHATHLGVCGYMPRCCSQCAGKIGLPPTPPLSPPLEQTGCPTPS
jgi:hypothetical protein